MLTLNPSSSSRRPVRLLLVLSVALLIPGLVMAKGCSATIANRNPSGEVFPTVVGESLEGQKMELPTALAGAPAVLLVGYDQGTQFDIDRWLMGLLQAETSATIIEVPTIPGLVPTVVSGWIDEGMRSGIPEEDWGAVVTLYGGAAKPVVEMTGNENARNARVVVLDGSGTIVWFDDTGYSPRKAIEIAALVTSSGG